MAFRGSGLAETFGTSVSFVTLMVAGALAPDGFAAAGAGAKRLFLKVGLFHQPVRQAA
jgi:hypothetical protein